MRLDRIYKIDKMKSAGVKNWLVFGPIGHGSAQTAPFAFGL